MWTNERDLYESESRGHQNLMKNNKSANKSVKENSSYSRRCMLNFYVSIWVISISTIVIKYSVINLIRAL